MTQGRASYSMEFDHYDYVPGEIAEKIIAHAKAARAGIETEEEEVCKRGSLRCDMASST